MIPIRDHQIGEVIGFEHLCYTTIPCPNTVMVATLSGDKG